MQFSYCIMIFHLSLKLGQYSNFHENALSSKIVLKVTFLHLQSIEKPGGLRAT